MGETVDLSEDEEEEETMKWLEESISKMNETNKIFPYLYCKQKKYKHIW